MKRILKMLGLSMVVLAILVVAIAGTVSAAGKYSGAATQTQNQGEACLCGECPCGDCVCGECTPIKNLYYHNYSTPGPNGKQNQNGK
jgi:hypothetical protein